MDNKTTIVTDHDLLIRLDERMAGFERTLNTFIELTSKKADIASVDEVRQDFANLRVDVKEAIITAIQPVRDQVKDNTTSINQLQRLRWVIVGGAGVLSVIGSYVVDIINNFY